MKTTLVYLGGVGFQELFLVLFIILLFLALRAIVLWYWKVTVIVENQQQQNKLLAEILTALKEKK